MSLPKDVAPGFPATNPQTTAVATPSGAFDEKGLSDPNLVTPNSTFPYVMPDGSTKTFFKNMPMVVSPAVKAALVAAGLVS